VVQSLQPGVELAQNCGDDSGLQEEPPSTTPPHHTQQYCVGCGSVQVSGIHNLPESEVGTQHQHHHQEGPAGMYFLRQLRKYNLPQDLLIMFYTAVIESVLCTSITVWFGSATKLDKNRLQRTVRSAEKIIGANLPTIQDLYTSRVRKR